MSDAAKSPAVTPVAYASVEEMLRQKQDAQMAREHDFNAATMWLTKLGIDYRISPLTVPMRVTIFDKDGIAHQEFGVTMMDALMKLAEKMPDVFDPAANGGKD